MLDHDGCLRPPKQGIGQLRHDTATHSLTFRKPSMGCLKAFGLNYILSPHHEAEGHQGLNSAPTFLCEAGRTATSLPTQAFRCTNEGSLRAQTSQGCILIRSGAKNRAWEGDSTSSGLETRARWRPWSASPCFLSACSEN